MFTSRRAAPEFMAETAGFVVVRLQAGPANRTVIAYGYVDDELVASASATDNYLADVISTPTQSFTIPVPKGGRVKIVTVAGAGAEVRFFPA